MYSKKALSNNLFQKAAVDDLQEQEIEASGNHAEPRS